MKAINILSAVVLMFLGQSILAQNTCCNIVGFAAPPFGDARVYCFENVSGCNEGTLPCTVANFEATFPGVNFSISTPQCSPATGDPCGNNVCTGGEINLPVVLVDFYTIISNEGIALRWSTSAEINNQSFNVERSTDGQTWSLLGSLKGAGTTQTYQEYSFMDDAPTLGANYYRLKQIDFDQYFEYGPIKVVLWRGGVEDLQLIVLPNPAVEVISPVLPPAIGNANKKVIYQVFDFSGRLIKTITDNVTIKGTLIDVTDLPAGNYILRARQDRIEYSARFVKISN